MKLYKHHPIDESGGIRLLYLEPGKGFEPLSCLLVQVVLSSAPSYEALSYTWGDGPDSESINCSALGESLTVKANLLSALQYLRYQDCRRILWIDAICIDQNNISEQNQQVKMMRDIYSRASRVVIWLGPELEGDREAFKTFENLYQKVENALPGLNIAHPGSMLTLSSQNVAAMQANWPDRASSLLGPVFTVFQKPWFIRVWVIQEAALSKDAVVICGDLQLQWKHLAVVAVAMKQLGLVDSTAHGARAVAVMWLASVQKSNMFDMLTTTRMSKATNPSDRIFSLMGLVSDSNNLGVSIDYNLKPSEVYLVLAKHALGVRRDFRYLSAAGCHESKNGVSVPSWVPDWTHQYNLRSSFALVQFMAGWRVLGSQNAVISIKGDTLKISGYFFDIIDKVGKERLQDSQETRIAAGAQTTLFGDLHEADEWLLESKEIASICNPYPSGQNHWQAFWRTLIAGITVNGLQAPASFAEGYRFASLISVVLGKLSRGRLDALHQLELIKSKRSIVGEFQGAMNTAIVGRLFSATQKRYMGLVPSTALPGDMVCFFFGADIPYIIRPLGQGQYHLVGDCYIHGLMNGEVSKMKYLRRQEFSLV